MTTELTPKQQIQAVIELLSDKSRWTTRQLARDMSGESVEPDSPNAVCWCVEGALAKVSGSSKMWDNPAWEALRELSGGNAPYHLNDKDGYGAVMDLLNRALESL